MGNGSMETTIYLVRHGETNWNKERRFQGQKDVPLNDYGRMQAKKLSEKLHLSKYTIDAIYSSDLKRAYETANIIADKYNYDVRINVGLRERFFGILEGLRLEDFKKDYPYTNFYNFDIDNNLNIEPYDDFERRIYNAILTMSQEHLNGSILIVSHGAAINSFLHLISNGTLGAGKTKISNTSITTVVYDHRSKKWRIIEINNASHMEAI